ncbi:B9 domain family-containing protein [Strongyloides ratti]|uniref:B9 domain-containing protein 1 n=1 Tax=Strongyloides ratti TaxID=34506 RepID=A0A090MSI8_STRRB|nr:B9 domain family-containing protein [Strongyloides ratti]CEF61208.1 B9 domain family-containing protein [Strongyloides ratti]
MAKVKSKFIVIVNGNIIDACFHQTKSLYVKYNFIYGPDWSFVTGIEEGISCSGHKTKNKAEINLNTLIEGTFSSTNPYKWPQLILSCYGPDFFGNDIILGYGAVYVPTTPGITEVSVPMFVPKASSGINKLIGLFTGRRAEFIDSRVVGSAEGRDVTRVTTQGIINVKFNVIIKDLKKCGYDVEGETMAKLSEFILPQHIFEKEEPSNLINTIDQLQSPKDESDEKKEEEIVWKPEDQIVSYKQDSIDKTSEGDTNS